MDKEKETEKERQERERVEFGVLGNIEPPADVKAAEAHARGPIGSDEPPEIEADEPMEGGSKHGESHHPGSRHMTEGTTGNSGTEVGGTRNYRTGGGVISSDIGARPE